MAFGAGKEFARAGEVFNNFTGKHKVKLLAEVEISRIGTYHIVAFLPQLFDLFLFAIQSHQICRLFPQNAVEPVSHLMRRERMVDAANVQDTLSPGKWANEGRAP